VIIQINHVKYIKIVKSGFSLNSTSKPNGLIEKKKRRKQKAPLEKNEKKGKN
jgi:hypothetical protein